MYDFAYALVRISPQTLTALAWEYTGLPPGSMRIESMAPVSRAARAMVADVRVHLLPAP